MRINQQFGMSVHILSYMSVRCHTLCTSNQIAQSIKTHPVVVRRLLGQLKKKGLVEIVRGHGGAKLAKDPKDITLLDIYEMFLDDTLLNTRIKVNEDCPVGASLNPAVEEVIEDTFKSIEMSLKKKTIADIQHKILEKLNEKEA